MFPIPKNPGDSRPDKQPEDRPASAGELSIPATGLWLVTRGLLQAPSPRCATASPLCPSESRKLTGGSQTQVFGSVGRWAMYSETDKEVFAMKPSEPVEPTGVPIPGDLPVPPSPPETDPPGRGEREDSPEAD